MTPISNSYTAKQWVVEGRSADADHALVTRYWDVGSAKDDLRPYQQALSLRKIDNGLYVSVLIFLILNRFALD